MLVVETIARIRRERFVKGKSIKEIVRELKVSRNTVRKVLRSGATSFEYMRTVQPRPKLGSWRADLDRMLSGNEAKPARERLTLIRIFEELRGLGYAGSYDAVRRYARKWLASRGEAIAEAYVPLSFAPGEAYQFDWSHEVVLINGVTVTVRSRMSGCVTAGCCLREPIRARPRRWCSTRTTAPLASSGAAALAESMTT
jgi:transcriptional regulator with XRE-family HTH domain